MVAEAPTRIVCASVAYSVEFHLDAAMKSAVAKYVSPSLAGLGSIELPLVLQCHAKYL